jgi:hypothetical protein
MPRFSSDLLFWTLIIRYHIDTKPSILERTWMRFLYSKDSTAVLYKPAKELSNSSTKTNQLQSIVMAAPVKQSRMVVYSVVVISMALISLTTIMPSAYAGTIFFAGSSTVRSSLFCIRASLLRTDQMNYCMQVVECTYAITQKAERLVPAWKNAWVNSVMTTCTMPNAREMHMFLPEKQHSAAAWLRRLLVWRRIRRRRRKSRPQPRC